MVLLYHREDVSKMNSQLYRAETAGALPEGDFKPDTNVPPPPAAPDPGTASKINAQPTQAPEAPAAPAPACTTTMTTTITPKCDASAPPDVSIQHSSPPSKVTSAPVPVPSETEDCDEDDHEGSSVPFAADIG